MRRVHIGSLVAIVSVAAAVTLGCGTAAPDDAAVAIRLVEHFKPESVSGTTAGDASRAPRQEWKFDGQPPPNLSKPVAATWGFEAGRGIAGLAIKDGRLTGRTTSDFPILRIERVVDLDSRDQVQAVEIRMRTSAGTNLSIATRGPGPVDFANVEQTGRRTPWNTTTPLQSGEEIHTYTLISPGPLNLSRVRNVLIRPTDAAGATFEIESVRIVSRREHLAGMASGVGWQGLAEIYRETLVARSPETLKMTVTLPARPWLDLALGIPDDRPATFRVGITRGDAAEQMLLEHTVTTPYRWEPRSIDLSSLGGQDVTLSLSIAAQDAGTLGFWGTPVVRARQDAPADRPRGVILIHADTLRPDHLDLYGHSRQTAPFLTTMAAEGVTFDRAYSQAGWTKVSSTSFLTSLYPTTHGVAKLSDRVPASATTVAEVYRAAGYATFATSSVPFTGQLTNLHQGVEELHEVASLVDAVGAYTAKTAREYVDRTADWIDRHRDGSFFVYLHVFDPHSPYEPRRPYDVLWADPSKRDAHIAQRESLRKAVADPVYGGRGMATRQEMVKAGIDPPAYLAYDKDWYDSSIRGLDAELARLVERLRAAGVDRDTLIVLISDHGEEFQEHGRMWHGQSVYGEMVHVPLVVRWPARVPAGARVEEPVQLVDVMPTLLSLSRLTEPPGLHGQSVVPLLQIPGSDAGVWKRRPVIVEKLALDGDDHPQNLVATGIIDGEWKLIHNRTRPDDRPEFELFHAKHDPLDQKNLAAENPETVQRLAKALEGWRTMAEAARLKPDAETTKGLSPEQLQRLRSLGYVR
jgi:arylsulfatase A-like enzyme